MTGNMDEIEEQYIETYQDYPKYTADSYFLDVLTFDLRTTTLERICEKAQEEDLREISDVQVYIQSDSSVLGYGYADDQTYTFLEHGDDVQVVEGEQEASGISLEPNYHFPEPIWKYFLGENPESPLYPPDDL